MLLNQKIERTAVTMSDLVSQADTLTQARLDDLFLATGFVMASFDLDSHGQIVVSAIVTETCYDFEPAFFDTLMDPRTLYSFAMFRPRFSALDSVLP